MVHPNGRRLAELARAVAQGELVIPIAKKFPLAEIREAQTLAESGPGGKVVLLVR
jgi:NADPH:quinone reductase-like Zn-dependent oxidoreductase